MCNTQFTFKMPKGTMRKIFHKIINEAIAEGKLKLPDNVSVDEFIKSLELKRIPTVTSIKGEDKPCSHTTK